MAITITLDGVLKLDQTAGLQTDGPQGEDDVPVGLTVTAGPDNDVLTGTSNVLDQNFLDFLNALPAAQLSDAQMAYAALVEGASDSNYVTVAATGGETISNLFFSDLNGAPLNGDQVFISPGVPLQTTSGQNIYLWSALGGKVVLATTSHVDATSGSLAAAFYIESNNSANTSAKVESITFMAIEHPNSDNPDDTVDFSDVFKVSATGSLKFDFDKLQSGSSLWAAVGNSSAGLLVTGLHPDVATTGKKTNVSDVIHTSQGGIDATIGVNNQLFDHVGETAVFTLVTGFTELTGQDDGAVGDYIQDNDKGTHPEVDYGGYLNVSGAGIFISQSQGGPAVAKELDINVFRAGGTPPGTPEEGFGYIDGLTDDVAVNVATVTVKNDLNAVVATWAVTPGAGQVASGVVVDDVKVTIAGNIIDVDGVFGEYTVSWTVDDPLGFNRFHVVDDNEAAGAFDIGGVDILNAIRTTVTIGDFLQVDDDGPTITKPFDADPVASGAQTPEELGNAAGQTASGVFGYNIGTDDHTAAFYAGGGSDFVDVDPDTDDVQISLGGTVGSSAITNTNVTLQSEGAGSALFDFSFHYDKDPFTAGVQDGSATGTLAFDKDADTYTVSMTTPVEGFSFSVLHTNELLAKAPAGNTGHPEIVVTELDTDTPGGSADGFYVQFTSNTTTQQIGFGFNSTGDGAPVGDTTFNNGVATHDMITNLHEDWVSATQTTNGVAGDTIQKGEALTLRFFAENILGDVNPNAPGGGTETVDPTTTADGVAIKFDGIGASEDLIVILDLKDANGNEITRAINVQNSDLIKGNVPAPYNAEFSLDNNDALLVMEANDYNAAGETYQIQGIQIMQSANGLTGDAINLNGAVGAGGGSNATSDLTTFDPTDNDVLKIVDIGFIQTTSGTQNAALDFSFQIADDDNDVTTLQHIQVAISNDFIV
jgi:hypothetical protein